MADPSPAVSARFPDLAGRSAIVTGVSRGIGCGIAAFLARQGMKLTVAARSAGPLQAFAKTLESAGTECLTIPADVATKDGARRVFEAALERFARLDLLVSNAAQTRSAAFLKLDEEMYRGSFEANVRMVYELGLLAARRMAESGGGAIVHVSSVGGLRAHRGLAGYDASKGAIDALTRAMAVDLAPHGVRVNAVAPGAIAADEVPPEYQEKHHRRAKGVPVGRLGTPEEIGAAVAFLASDAAAYITGQVLYVDGGLTAQLTPPGLFV